MLDSSQNHYDSMIFGYRCNHTAQLGPGEQDRIKKYLFSNSMPIPAPKLHIMNILTLVFVQHIHAPKTSSGK